MRKNKLCIIFFLIFVCNVSVSQWYPQNSNTTSRLHSVYFIDQNTGWVCGFETVLKTTNGGNSWTSSYLAGYLRSIYFHDSDRGWICGDNGKLFKTIDGGSSWILVNLGITINLNQITFINHDIGLIAGYQRTILKTTNSGLTWINLMSNNSSLDLLAVEIINSNTYVVSGVESTIYKTTDSGITWDSTSFGIPTPLLTIEFINENTGWVSGCCGMFLRTTNFGLNWSSPEVYLTPGITIYSLKFANANTGWCVGGAGYILRTTNGGLRWDSLASNNTTDLYSTYFVSNDTGFVVGNTGLILRTTNGGGNGFPIGVKQLSSEIPDKYNLFQNYPNPFNPVTTIEYELLVSDIVTLKIFDVSGKEIATLINRKQNAGKYSIEWNAFNHSSGIYFYTLNAGEFVNTKRMILLK